MDFHLKLSRWNFILGTTRAHTFPHPPPPLGSNFNQSVSFDWGNLHYSEDLGKETVMPRKMEFLHMLRGEQDGRTHLNLKGEDSP